MDSEKGKATQMSIPFTKPWLSGWEETYIQECIASRKLCGNRDFSRRCEKFLEDRLGAKRVLLTPSCTAALEMSALLCDVGPGDEVILPSFTFSSTANAFLLRGATLRFVEVDEETLNIDPCCVSRAINSRSRVVVPVHYAGVACEMDEILELARINNLLVVEDAAQAVAADYKGKALGTLGDLGTFSFHETKNFVCGEGGALVVNKDDFWERAEIIREKGTNRTQFFKGEVDKYTWVDVGSSYVLSDILAAFLLAQLEKIDHISRLRSQAVQKYRDGLQKLEERGLLRLPRVPKNRATNHHLFHVLFATRELRDFVLEKLKAKGISACFHFVPLHSSPLGKKLGYQAEDLPVTERIAGTLLRLPLFPGISDAEIDYVCKATEEALDFCDREKWMTIARGQKTFTAR